MASPDSNSQSVSLPRELVAEVTAQAEAEYISTVPKMLRKVWAYYKEHNYGKD